MRYEISLNGPTFEKAKAAFERQIIGTLNKMRKKDITEGAVTLKLSITLEKQFPIDEDGRQQEAYVPSFDYEVVASMTDKEKENGKMNRDWVLRADRGGLALYDRDEKTLFEIVEGGTERGEPTDQV